MKTPPPARLLLPLLLAATPGLHAAAPADYLQLPRTFIEDFTTLDPTRWQTFAGRSNATVSSGELRLTQLYLDSAPNTDANKPERWTTGGIYTPDFAQKYGYYEVRMRIAPGWGLDNAFWFLTHNASVHDHIEIDAPEIFSRAVVRRDAQKNIIPSTEIYPATDDTYFVFNVYDQARRTATGDLTKIYRANFLNTSPLRDDPATSLNEATQFVTWGFEWKTDDTLAFYRDGVLITDPNALSSDRVAPPDDPDAQVFPDIKITQAIDRAQAFSAVYPILTTLPLSWLGIQSSTNAAIKPPLHGKFMGVAHFYAYQKPGWSGSAGSAWNLAANWGPDGVPGVGKAAVFNQATASNTVQIPSDWAVKSLYFDRASVPALTFEGGPLRLGANVRDEGVGGILMTPQVTTSQTIEPNIDAQLTLQFANLASPASGPAPVLTLQGEITSSRTPSPSLHFNAVSPISATGLIGNTIGSVAKWGAGAVTLANSENAFTGPVTLISGPLRVRKIALGGQNSSLGASSADAANLVIDTGRGDYSAPNQPRLIYEGAAAAVTDRDIFLTRHAKGILETSGGALTWLGDLVVGSLANGAQPFFALGGTGSGTFSGELKQFIDDEGNGSGLLLDKTGSGSWTVTGTIDTGASKLRVWGGTLSLRPQVGASVRGSQIEVNSGAVLVVDRTHAQAFTPKIKISANATLRVEGSGAFPDIESNAGVIDARRWTGSGPISSIGTVLKPLFSATPGTPVHVLKDTTPLAISVPVVTSTSRTVAWTVVAGNPASVTFDAPTDESTSVTFAAPGFYTLRATVTDSGVSAQAEIHVFNNPWIETSLSSGSNGLDHVASFIRADFPAWNSGGRDTMLVGRTSAALRPVFSFQLGSIPAQAVFGSTTLTLWTHPTQDGSGTQVQSLKLHALLATPIEGTGNSATNAEEGKDTGVTWTRRTPTTNWSSPGGDFSAAELATTDALDPSENSLEIVLSSTANFAARTQEAFDSGTPLDLLLRSPATETGATQAFLRLASDDHPNTALRPILKTKHKTGLASPWDSFDIGSPGLAGIASALNNGTVFALEAAGQNIGGTADQFHFARQIAAGDCTLVARVTALAPATGYTGAKAGLMIRAGTGADAANVFLGLTTQGLSLHRRQAQGTSTVHFGGSPWSAPRAPLWLRLSRVGATISAACSRDGQTWPHLADTTLDGLPPRAAPRTRRHRRHQRRDRHRRLRQRADFPLISHTRIPSLFLHHHP